MDPMVPDADAQEQHTPVVDEGEDDIDHLPDDPEVPEADAYDQARSVPYDDDERE